jgi:hypothetical protein
MRLLFSEASRSAQRSTGSPIQRAAVKRPGREVDPSTHLLQKLRIRKYTPPLQVYEYLDTMALDYLTLLSIFKSTDGNKNKYEVYLTGKMPENIIGWTHMHQ